VISLAGRQAVVTGGANGIGLAVVRALAAAGADGSVLDLPDQAPAELPAGWSFVGADVREESSLAAGFEQAAGGGLDVLVAAAGVVPGWTELSSLELADYDRVMAVNARGLVASMREAARRLRPGGSIVAIASLNAWQGDPRILSYVASKHAALGAVRAAALDLGRHGIRVNAVAPGPIATEAFLGRLATRERELGIPVPEALAAAAKATALGRIATVDEVAGAVLFLASDLAAGITGSLLPVDAGIA
jgi:NAD(P)-dependent dehydrogenase (short-subunit alcohol dehydrogenase family)